jgi:hypothetical protein
MFGTSTTHIVFGQFLWVWLPLLVPYERLASAVGERGALEGNAVRLTVDSNEPLEDAIRVVGSLYGVTLVVSDDGREVGRPTRRSTADELSASDRPRRRARVSKANSRKSAPAAAGADGAASNADIRSWARHRGLAVNGRGRVPASVMKAYRQAHG